MKNFIKKYIVTAEYLLISCALLFVCSCQLLEEEENFSIKNQNNPISSLKVSFGASSDFNLSSADGAFVDLVFDSNQEFTESLDIYASLNSVENPPVLVSTLDNVPTALKLDIADVMEAFEGQSTGLGNGDLLFLTFRTTINDESYQFNNTALSSGVICNSMISTAEDRWTGNGFTDNGPSFPGTSTAENIQIIPMGDDNYLISDISAGWYDAINFRPIQEGIYNDNCNQITWVGPGENRQFNFVDSGTEGSWDPETGTLTIYWFDEGNEFGGKSVFTKNE